MHVHTRMHATEGPVAGSGLLALVCTLAICEKHLPETREVAFEALGVLCVNAFAKDDDPLREV